MKVFFTTIFLWIMAGFMFGFVVSGCRSNTPIKPTRINHVVRILMHERNYFTVLIQNPGSKVLERRSFESYSTTFVADVASGEDMWLEYDRENNYSPCGVDSLTLHVHSATDIHGAGWNHGKFGRGMTEVVE